MLKKYDTSQIIAILQEVLDDGAKTLTAYQLLHIIQSAEVNKESK